MIVVPGTSSKLLAERLVENTGLRLVVPEIVRFPDGECYVRIPDNLDDEEVMIIQNTYPDEKIIELLLLQDAVREFNIENLTVVIPYFGYARQDKKFNVGEPVSVRAIIKGIQRNVDYILTIDIHDEDAMKWFDTHAMNISGMTSIGNFLKENLDVDIVIAPDDGALPEARIVANTIGCEYDGFEKKRISAMEVQMETKELDIKNKTTVIVDDIISTGGTILETAKLLMDMGAKDVYAACTHGLFVNNALDKLKKICKNIFSTDTIETSASTISVWKNIADVILNKN